MSNLEEIVINKEENIETVIENINPTLSNYEY